MIFASGPSRILLLDCETIADLSFAALIICYPLCQHDLGHRAGCAEEVACSVETPQFTFTLPDITRYSADFRGFLEKVRHLAECYLAAEFDAGCVLGPDRDVCAGQSGAGRPPQLVGEQ